MAIGERLGQAELRTLRTRRLGFYMVAAVAFCCVTMIMTGLVVARMGVCWR